MTIDGEIWLYGSRARGDADDLSDTDLLLVGGRDLDIQAVTRGMELPRINVSFYSWEEIEAMYAYGSLYLHHLKTEGRQIQESALHPGRFRGLLTALPPFARAREDLTGFRLALDEALDSLGDGGWPDFECEVIATVARHAAILGSYCLGDTAFGRERPFQIVGEAFGYSEARISTLARSATAWRLHQPGAHAEQTSMEAWLSLVDEFLADLERVVNDYAAILPQTT